MYRKPPFSIRTVIFQLLFGLLFMRPIPHAGAATFTVNSGFDVNDLEPGNGLCVAYLVIIIPAVLPYCTLRGAIEEANNLPGDDTIILGSGTYRLSIAGQDEDLAHSGDLDITDSVHIIGAGVDKTFIDADKLDRVIDIHGPDTAVVLSGVSIINGNLLPRQASHKGGGLRNQGRLIMQQVTISGNSVPVENGCNLGGGMYNNGRCSITDTTIKSNRAGTGGAVYNDRVGRLYITSSTLYNNTSLQGGGIVNRGTVSLVNSTITANTASADNVAAVGALLNCGNMTLTNCTVAANRAAGGTGGVYNEENLSMTNTLIADNDQDNCFLRAGIHSNGGNLDSGTTCGLFARNDDLFDREPLLAPLRNNGGPTPTMALRPGSPAIDAGIPLASITIDQRGLTRPRRKSFDIGAFELNNMAIAPCITPLLLP